jgi:hypothetical protein
MNVVFAIRLCSSPPWPPSLSAVSPARSNAEPSSTVDGTPHDLVVDHQRTLRFDRRSPKCQSKRSFSPLNSPGKKTFTLEAISGSPFARPPRKEIAGAITSHRANGLRGLFFSERRLPGQLFSSNCHDSQSLLWPSVCCAPHATAQK